MVLGFGAGELALRRGRRLTSFPRPGGLLAGLQVEDLINQCIDVLLLDTALRKDYSAQLPSIKSLWQICARFIAATLASYWHSAATFVHFFASAFACQRYATRESL
jgi:hypothetical protein